MFRIRIVRIIKSPVARADPYRRLGEFLRSSKVVSIQFSGRDVVIGVESVFLALAFLFLLDGQRRFPAPFIENPSRASGGQQHGHDENGLNAPLQVSLHGATVSRSPGPMRYTFL